MFFGASLVSLLIFSQANAGFFSSIIGNEAEADTVDRSGNNKEDIWKTKLPQTLQTMALLEANVSFITSPKNKKVKEESEIQEDRTVRILSDNALVPTTGPQSVSEGMGDGDFSFDQMSIYVVRKGDSLSEIAEMFDVSTNTILWANDLKKGQKLTIGDTLLILPVSGVKHEVAKGQTLGSIAKLYKVDITEIIDFNGLPDGAKISIGDELIIPDGIMSERSSTKIASSSSSSSSSSSKGFYSSSTLKNIVGYFINPVPNLKRKSQGLHGPGHRGIDLAAPTGTHVYASAPGEVLLARNGYNGGYGKMIILQHSNGTKTLYAHLSQLSTSTNATVDRGELIGYVGSTGRSTGPHLHFEVFNAKNPGADWSWAN